MLLRWLIITIITYTKVLFVSMLMLRICSYQLMIPLIDEYLVFFKSIRIDMKLVVYSIPLPPNPIELNWTKLNCLYSISVGFGVTSKIWLFSVQSKIFSQPGLNSINITALTDLHILCCLCNLLCDIFSSGKNKGNWLVRFRTWLICENCNLFLEFHLHVITCYILFWSHLC